MVRRPYREWLATLAVLLVIAAATGGCNSTSATVSAPPVATALPRDPTLAPGVLTAADLPSGDWQPYTPAPNGPGRGRICGIAIDPTRPEPTAEAAGAWATDPTNGPIVGERIERYRAGDASLALTAERLTSTFPCEFDDQSSHWRDSAVSLQPVGDDTWAYVIESVTGVKGFTYEAIVRRGDDLIKFVLSVRSPNVSLLQDVVDRGLEKAKVLTP